MTDFKYALNRSSIMRPVSLTSSVVSGLPYPGQNETHYRPKTGR